MQCCGLPPPSADLLGQSLHLLRLGGSLCCRAALSAPWATAMPALPGCPMIHVVTAGQAWLEAPGLPARLLAPGSLALVPHGAGHTLRSDPQAPVKALFSIPVQQVSGCDEVLRQGRYASAQKMPADRHYVNHDGD